MSYYTHVDTAIVQCPTPAILQPFCRADGTLIWRAATSQHGCEGERWYRMVNGALTLTCRPNDLTAQCKVEYLAPTCVEDANGVQYTRYTVILPGQDEALGVVFFNRQTGALASISADDVVSVCEPSVEEALCEGRPSIPALQALVVKVCDEPERLLRSQIFFDCNNGAPRELVQEVWATTSSTPGGETRTIRYYECGTDEAIDAASVNVEALLKCTPCEALIPARASNCKETAAEPDPTTDVFHVTETGAGGGTSWSDAGSLVDALSAGTNPTRTEIWVQAGVYNASVDGIYTINRALRIYGGFSTGTEMRRSERNSDPATNGTVLSGGNATRVMNILTASTSIDTTLVDGFTLRDGSDTSASAVFLNNGSGATFRNCLVTANMQTGFGVITVNNSNVRLCQSSFVDNIIMDAPAGGFRSGGAVMRFFATDSEQHILEAVNCQFVRNVVTMGNGTANPILLGGAFTIQSEQTAEILATFVNCVFAENAAICNGASAQGNGARGGAFYLHSGETATLETNFVNCTFANNRAVYTPSGTSGGGAVHIDEVGTSTNTVDFRNCILWENEADVGTQYDFGFGTGVTANFRDSLVQDAATTGISGTVNVFIQGVSQGTDTSAIKDEDPLFVAAPSNVRLQPASPAIDCGFNAHLFAPGLSSPPFSTPPVVDLDGNSRVINGVVDMGAYEAICSASSS